MKSTLKYIFLIFILTTTNICKAQYKNSLITNTYYGLYNGSCLADYFGINKYVQSIKSDMVSGYRYDNFNNNLITTICKRTERTISQDIVYSFLTPVLDSIIIKKKLDKNFGIQPSSNLNCCKVL